ncbi:hypothetical protein KKF34_08865 [Myxococcota bacterium]|nr:hypothetical protein [Myxococcota bacterium]MBU1380629.1 hypothetical protein [Myxococcota bacterium]MBU1496972.1 hypothetical protein [Myxococcota bacterium]
MKKFLLVFTLIAACSSTAKKDDPTLPQSRNQNNVSDPAKTPENQVQTGLQTFLNDFVATVLKFEEQKILGMLEKEYVKTQLDQFKKKDVYSFVSELFCGNSKSGKFKCFVLRDIISIEIKKIGPATNGTKKTSEVVFSVKSKDDSIQVNLTVVYEKSGFSIRGAVG